MDFPFLDSAPRKHPYPGRGAFAGNELLVSEARYRRLFETAQDGILILDGSTGNITDANPFLLNLLGYSLDDLMGRKLWEIGPFKDIENSQKAFSILQQDDYIRYENLPLQSKLGVQVDVEFVSNAYPVDGCRVIQCNIRDITNRKRAERALKTSILQLQGVLARNPTIVYSLGIAGLKANAFNYMSENVGQLLGYDVAEVYVPGWWLDRVHPEDVQRVLADKNELLERGMATTDYRFRHKDKSYRWLGDEQRVVRDSHNNPLEIVGSWTEITERKGLEDRIRQATKMEAIGRLAGGVAHDFNNLLSVIIGYSQMLLRDPSFPADVRVPSEQIFQAAERATSLTRQLLAFSRKQLLRIRNMDLNEAVVGFSNMLQRIIGEDVTLAVKCSAGPLLIAADEGLFEQVLMNLAVNARDAMPNGGQLSISTGRITIDPALTVTSLQVRTGRFVWMRVGDNGCGMTPETQARIFEPFFTTKEIGKGTGLGLATAYGIMQQHRGWIEVKSELAVGSSFTIFFPAAEALSKGTKPIKAVAHDLQTGTETILLVEDELALQTMAVKILERLGYRVYTASNGPAALIVWAQRKKEIDLLLTDMVMPEGLTGSDLAIKFQSESPGLPVVVTSGYNSLHTGKIVLKEGVSFLQKPYTLEALSQSVRTSLDEAKLKAKQVD